MALPESVFNFIKDYIDTKVQTAIEQALKQNKNSTIEIKEYEIKSYGEPVYIKIPTYVTPSGTFSKDFSNFTFTGSDGNLYSYIVPFGTQILTTEDGKLYYINDKGQIVYLLLPDNSTVGSNAVSDTNGTSEEDNNNTDDTSSTNDTNNETASDDDNADVAPECVKYFEGINVNTRDLSIPGYTIEYMPSEPIKKDTEYTYTVHAIVTHDESGCTKTYSFEETTYPEGVQIDKYGRTVIQYDEITPTNCVDKAVLEYAKKNAVLLVKPKETEADKAVADMYKTVLKRTLIDSEGMELWVNEYNTGKYTIDELKKKMALGTPNIKGLEEASYFARAYLYSIEAEGYESGGRYPVDICEVPDSPCRRAILIPELKNIFVDSDGSDKDNMIKNAYKEVLDRDYVDVKGFVSWRKALEENNWTYEQLKEKIAESALTELSSGRCVPNIYDAYIYLHPYDNNGRKYVRMTEIPQTECWEYAISQKNPEKFNFVEPNENDDTDKLIAKAYKVVLDRDYIESYSFQKWYDYVKNNNSAYFQLCQAIAQSAKESTADCPTVKEKAEQWLKTGTFDIFGDGSVVAFYQFEDNANDTGGVHNGEWHGNELYDEGVIGKAAKFDGNSYINCGTDPIDENSSYTVSIWGKYNGGKYLISSGAQTSSTGYAIIYNSSSEIIFSVKTTSYGFPPYKWNGDTTIFRHFALVHDSKAKTLKIFIDGKLQTTLSSIEGSYSNTFTELHLGKPNNKDGYHLNGFIDQLRLFNRALTDDEVKILYNEGATNDI